MTDDPQPPKPDLGQPHRAGECESFPTGRLTYLAPLPLPTGGPATDHSKVIGAMNERYLDFGGGKANAFAWQFLFGIPIVWLLLWIVIFPLFMLTISLVTGMDGDQTISAISELFGGLFLVGLAGVPFSLYGFLVRYRGYQKLRAAIPTRFNRQRREVCFQPEGHTKPVFVPWESVVTWIMQAQGGSQYGIMRQYGLGLGFHDPKTDTRFDTEFQASGLPLAIANWEAIRAYMEYEVNDLREVQDPLQLQGSDDPDHEGVHFFYSARARMRRRRREGEVGWIYTFFWYVYHILTLWTLPNRMVEWEERLFRRLKNENLPESMEQWSRPLPEDQWAKPSDTLQRLSRRARKLQKQYPGRPAPEVFAQVYEEEERKERSA